MRTLRPALLTVLSALAVALVLSSAFAPASTQLDLSDVSMKLGGTFQTVDANLGNYTAPVRLSYAPAAYTNGTGANAATLCFQHTYTITASGSTTLVLGNGSLSDQFGNAVTFAAVKEVWVGFTSANTASSILIGAAASNPWAGAGAPLGTASTTRVTNGGSPWRVSLPTAGGFTITGASNDQLKIVNEDNSNSALVVVCLIGK